MAQADQIVVTFQWPQWFDRLLKAFVALVIVANLAVLIESLALDTGLLPAASWSKVGWSNDPDTPTGWMKVETIDPKGQLGQAGVQAGDLLYFDNRFYHLQARYAGDRIGFTLDRNGQISKRSFVAMPVETDPTAHAFRRIILVQDLSSFALMGFSLLLLLRRWGDKAATCLALFLLAFSVPGATLPRWIEAVPVLWSIIGIQVAAILLVVLGLPFCHYLAKPSMSRREAAFIWGWTAVSIPVVIFAVIGMVWLVWLPPYLEPFNIFAMLMVIDVSLAIAILVRNFRSADAAGRNRVKLVAIGFCLIGLGYFSTALIGEIVSTKDAAYIPLSWLSVVIATAGPALMVYTVLRHKLFDFGFVVNRTLVYGIASGVILVSIGLAEWAAKKLVPASWHEASMFYSAAIALGLFLLFHRIRDWVEELVQHWLFHAWQANEAQLRSFIATAAHYERQDSLIRDTIAELRRFTGSDAVALFWKQDGDDYRLLHGSLAVPLDRIDTDDPAVARIRAERAAVAIEETRSQLPAALALPVIDQGQVVGLVALGAKPDAVGYRPDEVEILAWAVQQAGLDLQSMRARALEAKVASLETQLDRLSAILAARRADA